MEKVKDLSNSNSNQYAVDVRGFQGTSEVNHEAIFMAELSECSSIQSEQDLLDVSPKETNPSNPMSFVFVGREICEDIMESPVVSDEGSVDLNPTFDQFVDGESYDALEDFFSQSFRSYSAESFIVVPLPTNH